VSGSFTGSWLASLAAFVAIAVLVLLAARSTRPAPAATPAVLNTLHEGARP
jgi:hypothetical protein